MNNNKVSTFDVMRNIGCCIFDIAMILAYFKIFGLFFIIAPEKSILILLFLIIGLISINGAVIFPKMLYKCMGIPYSAAISTTLVLYAIISNIVSILLIPSSTIWYLICELIISGIFIIIFSVVLSFSKNMERELVRNEKEQSEKVSIMLQLLEIESVINEHEGHEGILECNNSFKILKERISASTPFGRISGNAAVFEIEQQIKDNLLSLKEGFEESLTQESLIKLQRLIEGTRQLVINREKLNIK